MHHYHHHGPYDILTDNTPPLDGSHGSISGAHPDEFGGVKWLWKVLGKISWGGGFQRGRGGIKWKRDGEGGKMGEEKRLRMTSEVKTGTFK